MTATLHRDPYHSRVEGESGTVDRLDPVVWGGPAGPLARRELDAYERDGFLIMPGLMGPERVAALWEASQTLAVNHSGTSEGVITEPGGDAVRSVFLAHRRSRCFADLVADPQIRDRARQLLGGDVYVHQSRVNFKPGFVGKEFYWHSDFETWHMEDGMPRMRAVSVSVLLSEANEFNGPLMLIPGSHGVYVRCPGKTPEEHYRSSLRKQEYGVPTPEVLTDLTARHGITSAKGPPGTVVFFECNIMHGSSGNMTPYQRNSVFLVYNSVDNRLEAPFAGTSPRPEFLAARHREEDVSGTGVAPGA